MLAMAQRFKVICGIGLLLPALLLNGCKAHSKPVPVVIHVLRNLNSIYGVEFDRRLLDFQGSNPKLSSGRPVVVQTATGDFKDTLQRQTDTSKNYDLIILDSPDDANLSPAVQADMSRAVNICAGLKACPANVPAIIPPQITGPTQEAALLFQNALQKAP